MTTGCTDAKLICIPGLVIRGIDNGVEGGNDTARSLDVVGAAAVPTGVSTQVRGGSGHLERLTHLTASISLPPSQWRGGFGRLNFVFCRIKWWQISQYL